eukprot:gene8861-biopygen14878
MDTLFDYILYSMDCLPDASHLTSRFPAPPSSMCRGSVGSARLHGQAHQLHFVPLRLIAMAQRTFEEEQTRLGLV